MPVSEIQEVVLSILSKHKHGLRACDLANTLGYTERYTRCVLLRDLIRAGKVIRIRHRQFFYYSIKRKDMVIIDKDGKECVIKAQLPFDNIHNKRLVVLFEELYRELEGLPLRALESEVDELRIDAWRNRILSVLGPAPRLKYASGVKSKKQDKTIEKEQHRLLLFEMRKLIHGSWTLHCEKLFFQNIEDDYKIKASKYNKKYNDIAEQTLMRIKHLRTVNISVDDNDIEACKNLFDWIMKNYDQWGPFYKKLSSIDAFARYYNDIINSLISTYNGTYSRGKVNSTIQGIFDGNL